MAEGGTVFFFLHLNAHVQSAVRRATSPAHVYHSGILMFRLDVASVIASTQASRAPTVQANISTPNGTCTILALPDTGADISAAGLNFLESLGEPLSNLLPPRRLISPSQPMDHP